MEKLGITSNSDIPRYLEHQNESKSSAKHLAGLDLNVLVDTYIFL